MNQGDGNAIAPPGKSAENAMCLMAGYVFSTLVHRPMEPRDGKRTSAMLHQMRSEDSLITHTEMHHIYVCIYIYVYICMYVCMYILESQC